MFEILSAIAIIFRKYAHFIRSYLTAREKN